MTGIECSVGDVEKSIIAMNTLGLTRVCVCVEIIIIMMIPLC